MGGLSRRPAARREKERDAVVAWDRVVLVLLEGSLQNCFVGAGPRLGRGAVAGCWHAGLRGTTRCKMAVKLVVSTFVSFGRSGSTNREGALLFAAGVAGDCSASVRL